MEIIKAEKLRCKSEYYIGRSCSLDGLSFTVSAAELLCVLGAADAGKTALAQSVVGLIPIEDGKLSVFDMDCRDSENHWEIRKKCALVFENAENMYISTYVQTEAAIAARNFGTSGDELEKRVRDALSRVGLEAYENSSVPLLGAFERYLLAIASVLAYDPEIIILDSVAEGFEEAEREKVFMLMKALHEEGKTVVYTSRRGQDAVMADRVLLLKEGNVLAEGSPRDILSNADLLSDAGIELPFTVRIYMDLQEAGAELSRCPLDIDELVEEICR